MACDEILFEERCNNKIPNTFRLFLWNKPTVSMSNFQSTENFNKDFFKSGKVDLVRRKSGGGVVIHNQEITYSFFVSDDVLTNQDKPFFELNSIIICALRTFGITAEFKAPNDILVDKKKISGNAQVKRGNIILHHGTLLLSVDEELFEEVFKNLGIEFSVDKLNSFDKYTSAGSFELLVNKISGRIIKEVQKYFSAKILPRDLSEEELKKIKEVQKTYESDEWTYKK